MSFVHKALILLGRCVEVSRTEGVEVIVTMRELDSNLRMFFPERYTFMAYDPKDHCRIGDIVLMKKLDKSLTRKITHEIINVVYPLGDITDPVTGKKVIVGQYRDSVEERDRMFASSSDSGYANYQAKLRNARKEDVQTDKNPAN